MARLLVRDKTTREFEIEESALPFWAERVEVVDRIPEIGEETPAVQVVEPATEAPADDPLKPAKTPKPTDK